MTAKPVAQLLADLGITKTHSRPHTANDNPFSESQFKTLKYRPEFPDRFGSLEDARSFCGFFFTWYNTQHHHSALGLLTPQTVHYQRAPQVISQRQQVLTAAYLAHPERFVRHPPRPPQLPAAVWINPPALPPAMPSAGSILKRKAGSFSRSRSNAGSAAASSETSCRRICLANI